MKFLGNHTFTVGLRWVIGGIFIYAGAAKIGAPQNFSDNIAAFAILPDGFINIMATALPPFEILAGLSIVTGIQHRAAFLALLGLTSIFLAALGSTIARGIVVDCGCFGSNTPSVWKTWVAIGRDMFLLAGCGWGYWKARPNSKMVSQRLV